MRTTPRPTKLELKRECIRLIIRELLNDFQAEQKLLDTLTIYETMLTRESSNIAPSAAELSDARQAVDNAEELLQQLMDTEPVLMSQWFHGISPTNAAFGLANMLSRVILECKDQSPLAMPTLHTVHTAA